MNLDDRILALENRCINFLTIFTWWSEVRFGITNVRLATFFSTLSSLFGAFSFFVIFQDLYEEKRLILLLATTVIIFLFILRVLIKVLMRDFFEKKIIEKNPQGLPNPCRISSPHSGGRRLEIFIALVLLINLNGNIIVFFMFLSYLLKFLVSFLLACDSIPQEEKDKRRGIVES